MGAKAVLKTKMQKHKIHKDRYIATFALATLCFIIGILIGNAITSSKIAKVESMEDKLKFDIMSLEIENLLATENPCSAIPETLEEQLGKTTIKISFLENQLGKDDLQVLELKKYYSLLEIRHWLFMQKRKERCGENYTLVLFFYSNKPENIDLSEKQGYVLDYLRNEYGLERLKVYSLDYDLDLGVIKTLIEVYDITEVPSMIIDGGFYLGFHSKDELEKLFK